MALDGKGTPAFLIPASYETALIAAASAVPEAKVSLSQPAAEAGAADPGDVGPPDWYREDYDEGFEQEARPGRKQSKH